MIVFKNHPNQVFDNEICNSEEPSAKVALALKLNTLIDQKGLSQKEAAILLGMTQPKVSQVRQYKLKNISLERLMLALVALDQHVKIIVHPAYRTYVPSINVVE
ncbi:XRE family transcriptional regulator [Salmonella bongori]|nr:XRE family transcriptional regulator [Salmonella enterica]EBH9978700.1 XRE family transcriptional regulator [Salmonella enterica subsp. arizonae serovar 40:z36:-]EHM2231345.1 XRE family transcriptional regulator [Salmonella bongori]EIT4622278.1 XRE family transcriptional regulator [Salmonella bongori]